MKSDRRAFIGSLASLGALAACNGSTVPGAGLKAVSTGNNLFRPQGVSTLLPLEIVNNTPYDSKDIWFYCTGQKTPVPAPQPWFHISNAKLGDLKECQPTAVADYNLNLATDTDPGATPREHKMMLPSMDGGCRFYFSIKKKLTIHVGENAIPGVPNGWDPASFEGRNYDILFDWWEFVNLPAVATQGFNVNSTQVDMMGIPMSFEVFSKILPGGKATRGFKPGARTAILNSLKAHKDDKDENSNWAKCVITNAAGEELRAIAPNQAVKFQHFDPKYFDGYVTEVWDHYKTNKLKADTALGVWEGQVGADDNLLFTRDKQISFYFMRPTTEEVFAANTYPFCGDYKCPGPTEKNPEYTAPSQCVAAMAASLNRSILLLTGNELPIATHTPACSDALAHAYENSITNYYSKYMHAQSVGGGAYGFGFDDNCSGSSFLAVREPTKAILTLMPF
jgi:hypothetical protein